MKTVDLTIRPAAKAATYRIIRLHDRDRMLILSCVPAYLPSHWRRARSFPCCQPLVGSCPWCDSSERRDHAYLGVLVTTPTQPPFRAIVEAPPSSLRAAMEAENVVSLFGLTLDSRRSQKKATPQITLIPAPEGLRCKSQPIEQDDILRTLCKVYALPDPADFTTTAEWQLATRLRISSAEYSPAKHQPPVE